MTLTGFANTLRAFGAGLGIGRDKAIQDASALVLQRMLIRIFQQGKKSDGANIGKYTSEGYVFRRQKRGLQSGYVDLKFTGQLMRDIAVVKTSQGYAIAVRQPRGQIVDHIEARYGSVFRMTQEERQMLETELRKRIRTIGTTAGVRFS